MSVNTKTKITDTTDTDLINGLKLAEKSVKKIYLDELNRYDTEIIPRNIKSISIDNNIRLFKICSLVYNKDENIQDRLNNVYSSMHSLNLSVIFMIVSSKQGLELYIGTKTTSDEYNDFCANMELGSAFKKTFDGNFPGSDIVLVETDQCIELLKKILPSKKQNAVTSLTSLPSLKNDDAQNTGYVQGIEKFIDTMNDQEYAMMIISDPISGGQIEEIKHGYEELYTGLTPFAGCDITASVNRETSLSITQTEGYTDSISSSIAKTQSFTKGSGITKSESTTNTFGLNAGGSSNYGSSSQNTVTSSGSGWGKNLVHPIKGAGVLSEAVASGITGMVGGMLGVNMSQAKQQGKSVSENTSQQFGAQRSHLESHSDTYQKGSQSGENQSSGNSTMINYENKSIKVLLEYIDEHLKRIKECENYGMWSSAAYFISPSKETSIIAACAYKGIINGEGSALETASLNTWYKDKKSETVKEYLRHFTHPRFNDPDCEIDLTAPVDVTPSTMISTKELSVQCSIPYRSVNNVSVREMAAFGRNVHCTDPNRNTISIGHMYHMGKKYTNSVISLSVDNLREHTFITGSTGSGKSNTIYEIISELNKKHIPTLIVEPAKGEYKQIFGDTFHVFGTNPKITELLKINPFKFEDGIHVLEHIDRLIDIFNVCWPMYAAMPAILKEAVEDTYISAGWDLNTSVCSGSMIYPNFKDLLYSLRKVIMSSDYSQEVKDNYTGSLITRVKSLTNGLNGQMFTCDEIDNKILFEDNTIIDLSRIGSSETKSMVMGIIVMRLQERRTVRGGINLPLKHVTVLEEAHHLLRRTSLEQSDEMSNLTGKSVEMISNAIAEMRTYGEGFIIADQSPGLLDMSVIRNTNTKIILHLPDFSDRELVGKSAGLTDDQIIELSKIPTGIAAIYQNKWIEPVLGKIFYYSAQPKQYIKKDNSDYSPAPNSEFISGRIVQYLVSCITDDKALTDVEMLKKWLVQSNMESHKKIRLFKIFDNKKKYSKEIIEKMICDLSDPNDAIIENSKECESPDEWNKSLIDQLPLDTREFTDKSIYHILECIIHYRRMEKNDEGSILKWQNYMKGKGLL